MPRFVYAWDRIADAWPLRLRVDAGDAAEGEEVLAESAPRTVEAAEAAAAAAVTEGEVPAESAPRTVDAAAAETALRDAEERYPPPWFAVGSVEAASWDEAAEHVRAWHFT